VVDQPAVAGVDDPAGVGQDRAGLGRGGGDPPETPLPRDEGGAAGEVDAPQQHVEGGRQGGEEGVEQGALARPGGAAEQGVLPKEGDPQRLAGLVDPDQGGAGDGGAARGLGHGQRLHVGVAGDHPQDHPPCQGGVLLDPDGAGSQPEGGFELGDAGQGVGEGLALGEQQPGGPLLPVGGDVDVLEVGAVEVGGGGVLGPGGHGADHADLGAAPAVGPPRHPTGQHPHQQHEQQRAT
jgi:hypothetical protein